MRQATLLAVAIVLSTALSTATPPLIGATARAESLTEAARRKAYEDEMLARARAEAEERRREMAKARAEEERIAAEELAREEEARRLSERLRIAAEARKAAEAARRKQEAELVEAQRKAEAERVAEAKRRADEEARLAEARRRADQARIEEARRQADEQARIAEAQRRAEEARLAEARRREEEARVAEAQRRAEEEARIAEAQRKADEAEAAAKRRADAEAPASPAGADDRQFTVLIVLEPGHRGIRRHNPTADPILCANGGCFVSAGSETPAQFLPGRKAMGLGATLGRRAGACREQLGCVFRTLDLGALPVHVQPVDMRLVRHDRRAPQMIERDSQCRLDHGTIDCARPYVGPDYIMWVVPEWMAQHVGAAGLEAAVARGLITRGAAAIAGRPMPWN